MYVNDRGQMNFHDFVRSSRELTEANLKKAAEGVCTESEWSRFEIGDRLPEKLMRDRMVARLGISGEEYEEYLDSDGVLHPQVVLISQNKAYPPKIITPAMDFRVVGRVLN